MNFKHYTPTEMLQEAEREIERLRIEVARGNEIRARLATEEGQRETVRRWVWRVLRKGTLGSHLDLMKAMTAAPSLEAERQAIADYLGIGPVPEDFDPPPFTDPTGKRPPAPDPWGPDRVPE